MNGAPQQEYVKNEDAATPTVATDSVFVTGTISAHEERDNMSFDIPGAFVTTKTNEYVIMTLRGPLCKIMTRIDPKLYHKYITKDKKGKHVLYVQMYKSLYKLAPKHIQKLAPKLVPNTLKHVLQTLISS